jgi:hypothetical protein
VQQLAPELGCRKPWRTREHATAGVLDVFVQRVVDAELLLQRGEMRARILPRVVTIA